MTRISIFVASMSLCVSVFGDEPKSGDVVSFHKQVKPILQARCQGCHQPAKARGEYLMTDFARLLGGGESEEKAVVPGKPDESYLVLQVTPDKDGAASMPPKGKPLSQVEIDLIREWITQGAKDDSPVAAEPYSTENPPQYSLPPVVTSLDYSADGKIIAVAGFNEVLLHKDDG